MDEHLSPASTIFKTTKNKIQDFFPQTDCLQSRNILALMDFPEESKKIKTLERHIQRCSSCQTQLIAAQHYLRTVDEKIPSLRPDEEMEAAINTELNEIFSRIDFQSTEFTFIQKESFLRKMERSFLTFLDLAISWKMIPVYCLAVALFMVLSTFG